MTNEEKKSKIEELLKDQDVFKVVKVGNVNYRPHPYCITGAHVRYSNGILDKNAIKIAESHGAKCGVYTSPSGKWDVKSHKGWIRCNLPHDEHFSDNVAFLSLRRNATKEEASTILKDLVDKLGEKTVDGFALVETNEKFRIN